MHHWTSAGCRRSRHKSSNIPFPIIQGGQNGPVIMLIHTNCVSREKRSLLSGKFVWPRNQNPFTQKSEKGCIYDPNSVSSPPFKHPQQTESFWKLCLQVKQDLRFKGGGGGVIVKHICPCFYQYLLNNFTNIQIRGEKFISQILSPPKWSSVLLLKEITKSKQFQD